MVLVTALASALGIAVVSGPAADAAKPTPTPATAKLVFVAVVDEDVNLPAATFQHATFGLVIPGEDFQVSVQSQDLQGEPLIVGRDTTVAISGGGVVASLTIPRGESVGTVADLNRSATTNFELSAAGPKNSGYANGFVDVTVAEHSLSQSGLGADTPVGPACTLGVDTPTCVTVSVNSALQSDTTTGRTEHVFLSTSQCTGFAGDPACTKGRGKGASQADVASVFVDLAPGQVATAILSCDKSLCGNGGVTSYIPLVDKKNTGDFLPADPCPSKGVIGEGQGICVDLRQSTRTNAGDLYTYILFDFDARMSH